MSGIVGPRLSTIPPTFFNDYSFEFDGTDDYFATDLTIPSVMLGNFSMSFWIKMVPVSLGTYLRKHPVAVSTSVTAIDQTVHVRAWNTQYLVRQIGSLGGTGGVGTTDLSDNNWHHIAYTYTYDGGTTYYTANIYVDGNATPEVTSTMRTTGGYQTQGLYSIGVLTNWNKTLYSGTEFPGLIDEITGWDSALSTADIATLAGGPNNPTTALSVVPIAWYRMGDNAIYKSPQWLLPSNENKDKVSNYSMSFDGTDDSVNCGNNFSFTDEITVSCWVKVNTWVTYDAFVVQENASGSFYLRQHQSSLNGLNFAIYQSDATWKSIVVSSVAPVSDWFHLVGVADGSFVRMYVNGVSVGTPVAYDGTIRTSTDDLVIGDTAAGGRAANCNIDEVAIWNGTGLSASLVSDLYNNGSPTDLSSFAVTPLAWYRMGENAIFKDPQWLIPNNENKDKFSNYSMSFDGTDDWINCGRDSSLDFNNAITISAWIKTDATVGTTVMPILFKDSTGAGTRCYSLGFRPLSAGYDKAYIGIFHTNGNNTSVYTSTAGALSNGNWHHLMGTYDGTDNTDALKIYVDGVLDNTATPTPGDTGIHIKTNVDVAIGSISHGVSWWWEGGIDDVAVWGTDQSSNISFIYSGGTGGTPPDLSSLNPISYWKMGEDATFSTNWTVPDQIGINDGTSANMDIYDRVGESPSSSGNTVSYNMDIYDRVGSASGSENNALSYNMVLSGRTSDVPT